MPWDLRTWQQSAVWHRRLGRFVPESYCRVSKSSTQTYRLTNNCNTCKFKSTCVLIIVSVPSVCRKDFRIGMEDQSKKVSGKLTDYEEYYLFFLFTVNKYSSMIRSLIIVYLWRSFIYMWFFWDWMLIIICF